MASTPSRNRGVKRKSRLQNRHWRCSESYSSRHNLEIPGANPGPATGKTKTPRLGRFGFAWIRTRLDFCWIHWAIIENGLRDFMIRRGYAIIVSNAEVPGSFVRKVFCFASAGERAGVYLHGYSETKDFASNRKQDPAFYNS